VLCQLRVLRQLTTNPDALNRFTKRDDEAQTVQILRYVFPRQFRLHNVFTSKVDRRETAMPFKDYTLRETEIHQSMSRALKAKITNLEEATRWKSHVPKRLRGETVRLVNQMRILHQRCSYTELLRHYCPVKVRISCNWKLLTLNIIVSPFVIEARMEEEA
jgi:telomerase reverse transcriptase